MVEALTLVKERFDGVFAIHHLCEDMRMGGVGGPRKQFFRTALQKLRPVESYMLVSISAAELDRSAKWKLSLNGVAITRELKPQLETVDQGTTHALYVYDVTHALLKNPYEPDLLIVYDSRKPMVIETITLLTLYEVEKSKTTIQGQIGLRMLEPGATLTRTFDTPQEPTGNFTTYYIGLSTSANAAELMISDDAEHHRILRIFRGFNDYELTLKRRPKYITLKFTKATPPKSKAKLLYDIMAVSHIAMPKLVYDVKTLDDFVSVTIRNQGEVSPDDRIQVLLLYAGSVLDRRFLDPIPPGNEVTIKLRWSSRNRNRQGVFVRIVWRRAAKVFTDDIKLAR
ncbi:MAG: hypothetical protein DRO39_00485 [Thermoprotei archaeon]|nr:MAG: hypothetical protein DRO39_00485 [Thermoprotei archaeon]